VKPSPFQFVDQKLKNIRASLSGGKHCAGFLDPAFIGLRLFG
jgi:hypothetical protein